MEILYLTLEDVMMIHHELVTRYGGSHGVRDLDLLLSAVARPQASFSGEDLYPKLFDKAAALAHSLVMNHAFVDGNKRTAVTSCVRFLNVNGYSLKVRQKDLVSLALNIESKKWNIDRVADWLRANSKKI